MQTVNVEAISAENVLSNVEGETEKEITYEKFSVFSDTLRDGVSEEKMLHIEQVEDRLNEVTACIDRRAKEHDIAELKNPWCMSTDPLVKGVVAISLIDLIEYLADLKTRADELDVNTRELLLRERSRYGYDDGIRRLLINTLQELNW